MDQTTPTVPAPGARFTHTAEAAPAPPARVNQFRPGQRVKDSYGRKYWVDAGGALRREDGGKMSKAERKADKRQRRQGRAVR
jgi:hypothetical protein